MAKLGDVYGSGESLNAVDIVGKGDVPVTIESLREMKFDNGKKLFAEFRGKEKGLILNFTNAQTLSEISGSDESDDWIGMRVALFVTKVLFQGKRVDAIRIKAIAQTPTPAQRRAAAPPPEPEALSEPLTDDDIPF